MPPMSRHSPMRPLQMIMMAENTVSRGTAAVSGPPDSMIETMRATSMIVTASASTNVPNGSPTRCATTSAWCTAHTTVPASVSRQITASKEPIGNKTAAARTTAPRMGMSLDQNDVMRRPVKALTHSKGSTPPRSGWRNGSRGRPCGQFSTRWVGNSVAMRAGFLTGAAGGGASGGVGDGDREQKHVRAQLADDAADLHVAGLGSRQRQHREPHGQEDQDAENDGRNEHPACQE